MQSPFRARNWILFLLINVLVSAITAFLVVRTFTQAASRPALATATSAAVPPVAAAPSISASVAANANAMLPHTEPRAPIQESIAADETASLSRPTATAQSASQSTQDRRPSVRISAVVYPGQRTREAVVIVNEGDEVDLTGWTLSNPRGKVYTFGRVALFRESFIRLNTTSGVDVPTDLFWNQSEAVWQVGDEVVLRRGNEVIATYTVQ